MTRHTILKPEFVHYMPAQLSEGVLYISKEFGSVIHLCACGCGTETVTPIGGSDDWKMTKEGQEITLRPSIGNWQFPCRSHYYITRNRIEWL